MLGRTVPTAYGSSSCSISPTGSPRIAACPDSSASHNVVRNPSESEPEHSSNNDAAQACACSDQQQLAALRHPLGRPGAAAPCSA